MTSVVQVIIELGHTSKLRARPTPEGYPYDWTVYVKGANGNDISHFVEKVVFFLHESFPNPRRVCRGPEYTVSESGYASFELNILVCFKTKFDPKQISFKYDLFLKDEDFHNKRCEKLKFTNPVEEFRKKLFLAGGECLTDKEKSDNDASKSALSTAKSFGGLFDTSSSDPNKNKRKSKTTDDEFNPKKSKISISGEKPVAKPVFKEIKDSLTTVAKDSITTVAKDSTAMLAKKKTPEAERNSQSPDHRKTNKEKEAGGSSIKPGSGGEVLKAVEKVREGVGGGGGGANNQKLKEQKGEQQQQKQKEKEREKGREHGGEKREQGEKKGEKEKERGSKHSHTQQEQSKTENASKQKIMTPSKEGSKTGSILGKASPNVHAKAKMEDGEMNKKGSKEEKEREKGKSSSSSSGAKDVGKKKKVPTATLR